MNLELFDTVELEPYQQNIAKDAVILRGGATSLAPTLITDINKIIACAPFRHMITPSGFTSEFNPLVMPLKIC